MSAETHLRDAYQQWRQLAESEGDAIQSGNWLQVCECQNSLGKLQPRIIRLTGEAQQEWARQGADRAAKENDFRSVIRSLIELEQRNNSLLDDQRRAVQKELDALSQGGSTLRRIQRSYAPATVTGWHSFS